MLLTKVCPKAGRGSKREEGNCGLALLSMENLEMLLTGPNIPPIAQAPVRIGIEKGLFAHTSDKLAAPVANAGEAKNPERLWPGKCYSE